MAGTDEITELRRRLAAAEQVCVLFGWTGAHLTTDREKALHELWREWGAIANLSRDPGDHPDLSDERIAELARQHDERNRAALLRMQLEAPGGV